MVGCVLWLAGDSFYCFTVLYRLRLLPVREAVEEEQVFSPGENEKSLGCRRRGRKI
jgi:hypothetical protein